MNALLFFLVGQNLLTNPGFENWVGDSIVGWEIAHPQALPVTQETDTVNEGNFSVKITRASPTTNLTDALISDTISITGGNTYFIGAYFWDSSPNVYGRVQVNWYKDGFYLTYSLSSPTQDTSAWQLISAQRTAPDTANQAIFKIKIYGDTLSGMYFCDYAFLSTTFGIKENFSSRVKFTEKKTQTVFLSPALRKSKNKTIWNALGQKVSLNKKGIYFIKREHKVDKVIILN